MPGLSLTTDNGPSYSLVPEHLDFPPVVHDWVIKGLGMSSRVCVTGQIKDPMPLIEKSRAMCFGGRKQLFSHVDQLLIVFNPG